jgi:hypothetical protein
MKLNLMCQSETLELSLSFLLTNIVNNNDNDDDDDDVDVG